MSNAPSKQVFYDSIGEALRDQGWTRFTLTNGMSALFGKREGDLILTVGFTESNLYNARVTADFRLAGHTSVALSDTEAPRSRMRVGYFLTDIERKQFLSVEFQVQGVRDAWWARTPNHVATIARVISITAPRFLAQSGLVEEVRSSSRHSRYVGMVNKVAGTAGRRGSGVTTTNALPPEWVSAALPLIQDVQPRFRRALAVRIATDAWNAFRILPADLDTPSR